LAAHQKKVRRLAATLAFFDETGFLTLPYSDRTWGPIGQTPVLRHRLRHREKLTVLGSLTVSPARRRCRLYAGFLPGRSVYYDDLIDHFRRLRRTFRTPLVILLDNLKQHKRKELHNWCAAVGDVHLECFPTYAPELNAIEGVWGHGKCVTAAGRLVDNAEQLQYLAREAIDAASEQHLLKGFIRRTGLPFRFDLKTRKHQSVTQNSLIGTDTTATYRVDSVERIGHFELRDQLGIGPSALSGKLTIPNSTALSPSRFRASVISRLEETEKFLREARAAAPLKHPHIVSVHEGAARETRFTSSAT
jgi:hypothetical protein